MRTTARSSLRVLVAVAAASGLLLSACTDAPAAAPATPEATGAPAPVATPPTAPVEPLAVDWTDPNLAIPLPGGWTLGDCDGDAPLLCIADGDTLLGSVEAASSPFDDHLAGVLHTQGLEAALRAHVASYHGTFRTDRAAGCPDGYAYEEHPTVTATLAGTPALRYGFSVRDADGVEVERNLNYLTILGGQLKSVTAVANATRSCVHVDEFAELLPGQLAELQPTLDAIAAGSVLPASTAIVDGTVLGVDGGLDGGLLYFFSKGEKQRIQQPRAMTAADLTTLGVRVGPAVTTLVRDGAHRSYFAVVPPDGDDARLHVVIAGLAHPVVVQEVAREVVSSIPDAATDLTARLARSA